RRQSAVRARSPRGGEGGGGVGVAPRTCLSLRRHCARPVAVADHDLASRLIAPCEEKCESFRGRLAPFGWFVCVGVASHESRSAYRVHGAVRDWLGANRCGVFPCALAAAGQAIYHFIFSRDFLDVCAIVRLAGDGILNETGNLCELADDPLNRRRAFGDFLD